MQIHIGCSGWFYSHWRGIFYPPLEPTTKLWFAYYANVFQTVELNAPFYRWPKPATVRRWKREAPPGFLYSVKVNQQITHERRLVRTRALVRDYYEIASVLGEKMGCFLFQFPPSHKYTAARLKSIVTQLDPAYRNVVEFRHRSWWRPAVYRALAERRITFCAVSAPRLPGEFPPGQAVLYVRLSGKTRWYRHDYSPVELTQWAERIMASDAKEVWIYFNNDRDGHAIKNALMLRRILTRGAGFVTSTRTAHSQTTPPPTAVIRAPAVRSSRYPHVRKASRATKRTLQPASAGLQP
ncbi:MAG TPA: DUF72 domain-containing protein [Lacunisphaera sp.]